MACKVLHRLALIIKIEHALNMYFSFYIQLHCRGATNQITDIDSESLFLVDSLKNIHGYFSNMNSNDLY